MEYEILTKQQEIAFQKYSELFAEAEYPAPDFKDWYWHYCYENNLFNDRLRESEGVQ